MKDKFSGALSDIAMNFDNATDAAAQFSKTLASMILERKVTGPLAEGLISAIDGSSFFKSISGLLPSFDVGTPFVPHDMVAKIHKGERIVPANQNVPGTGVTVNNTFNFGSGVTRAEVAALLPIMERRVEASIYAGMQKGGNASRLIGNRA